METNMVSESIPKKKFSIEITEMTMDQLIERVVTNTTIIEAQFDLAMILYKLRYYKYSIKSFIHNIWIDKTDTTLPLSTVCEAVIFDIQNTLRDVIVEYSEKYPKKSNEYKLLHKIIERLPKDRYTKGVFREARELFYNN